MDHGNLSKLENGTVGYSRDVIDKIAKVLHVTVGVLFADPGVVEAAALNMRQAPLLRPEQLGKWQGPDDFDSAEDQMFLFIAIDKASRYVFALSAEDDRNAPFLVSGDEMIFDAKAKLTNGDFVVAQDAAGSVHVGRLRKLIGTRSDPQFEVIAVNNFAKCVSSQSVRGLSLRGTLIELRRTITASH